MTNPFGLTDVNLFAAPNVLDIDNDGDLDIFIGEENGDVSFFENVGNKNKPVFKKAVVNPFQLQNVADVVGDGALADAIEAEGGIPQYDFNPAFADLDNDGDQDVLVGMYPYGFTIYYENIGNAGNPVYGEPIINPFGLPTIAEFTSPAFADIDADGDLDLFIGDFPNGYTHYFENIGTKEAPVFAEAVINPFGLTSTGFVSSPEFEDIDADGDLDVFIGIDTGDALYFENIGDASNPVFAAAVTNPFGLESVGGSSSHEFADLDGDGDLDALLGTKDGLTFYFENVADSADTVPEFIRYKTTSANFAKGNVFQGDDLNDFVISKGGNDVIRTGNGRNQVKAGAGNDKVYGGAGNDVLRGEQGHDQLFGGKGKDRLFGGTGNDKLYGGVGSDVLHGEQGHDKLFGGKGEDRLFGGAGNDWILGGGGKDYMDGGAGNDTVDYDYWHGGGYYNLNQGIAGGHGTYQEQILNFENIKTGNGNDYIVGTSGKNVIRAGGGHDTLVGGAGNDRLTGGYGADSFRFTSLSHGVDTITDFYWQEGDKIEIDASSFGATSKHQFSYNAHTGALSFNASPNDGIMPQTFAVLAARPYDFYVSLDVTLV